jgi:hypothetical protein
MELKLSVVKTVEADKPTVTAILGSMIA